MKKIEPDHISIYSLIWEKGTLFWKQREKGILREMDEDLETEMYELIIETLILHGYRHYEISNFARPGKEAVHNSKYWENREFIALGLNASSNYHGKRYKNLKKFHEYYRALDNMKRPLEAESIEVISEEEKRKMEIILGLRLLEKGIEFFQDKRVEKLLSDKLLEKKKGRLVLTRKGLLLANDVFLEFI